MKRVSTMEMKKVGKRGRTTHSPLLSIRTMKKDTTTTIAVVVSKKVEKSAVRRNKIKRRIRESVKDMAIPKNIAIVIYPKKGITKLSFKEIKSEVKKVLVIATN